MRIVVLAALLVTAAAAGIRLDFLKGHRYTYVYEGLVTHAIPNGAANTLGMRVACQCHVDAITTDILQLTLEKIELEEVVGQIGQEEHKPLRQDVANELKLKLKLQIRVQLSGKGLVKEIKAHKDDTEWSLNIKRALVNLFQVVPGEKEQRLVKQMERTFVGECQVAYNIWRTANIVKITKIINYDKCLNRAQFKRNMIIAQVCNTCKKSLGYAPYLRSVGQIGYELETTKQGTILKRAWGEGRHVLTPFAEQGGHAAARARQTLTYVEVKEYEPDLDTDFTRITYLTFVAENPDERYLNNAEYQKYLVIVVMKNLELIPNHIKDETVTQKAAEIFSTIVLHLRKCNKETLVAVMGKAMNHPDIRTRKIALDALSLTGTRQAFEVVKEHFNKIPKEEIGRILLGLPFAQKPTMAHINNIWKICEIEYVAKDVFLHRHCMLAFGALVRKLRQNPAVQQDTKVTMTLEEYFQTIRTRLTAAKDEGKLTFIKAIGNSGESAFINDLLAITRDMNQLEIVRVDCIWALRHILRIMPEKVAPYMFPLFANAKESPEVRMAIFVSLLDLNPTLLNLQAVANIVNRELKAASPAPRSNQLASFVRSHLVALAYHNNAITKQRAMFARLILRQIPRVNFDYSYSKGMRMAMYAEKVQVGAEWEVNKMNVPDSFLPRNTNAKLVLNIFGHRFHAVEFGARMEGVQDILAEIIAEIRSRQRRSLWSTISSLFEGKSGVRRPVSIATILNENQSTVSQAEAPQPQKRKQISFFLNLFGNELRFIHFKQEGIERFAQDVRDLVSGKKQEIKFPNQGIIINRNGLVFATQLTKAFLAADVRHMVPTLVGVPLDLHLHASFVVRMKVGCTLQTDSSIFNLYRMTKINGKVQVIPSAAVFAHARMGLHTPYVRAGVAMKAYVHTETAHKIDLDMTFGQNYEIKYQHPQRKMNALVIQSDLQGYVQYVNPKTFEHLADKVELKLNKQHLVQVAAQCKVLNPLGINVCYEAQIPDFASMRLPRVLAFPAVALTKLRLTLDRTEDKPEKIVVTVKVNEKEGNEIKGEAWVTASSDQVTRKVPITFTFARDKRQLIVEANKIQAPTYKGDEVCKLTATCAQLKTWDATWDFGRPDKMYQIGVHSAIEDMGKRLRLQADWTEVPKDWSDWLYLHEPQIIYILQRFAWIRRPEAREKKLVVVVQLLTERLATLRIQTPSMIAERTKMPMAVTINRFPQSIAEIKQNFYATCEVRGNEIKVFDQLKYKVGKLNGACHYLARDHVQDREARFHVLLKSDAQGQRNVVIQLKKPNVRVEICHDMKATINGKECLKECIQQGVTVRKVQVEGRTTITVSTPLGLYASTDGQQLQLQAWPMLRGRVRGLCGDADGEQWNEFRTPQDKVLSHQRVDEFVKSWETKC